MGAVNVNRITRRMETNYMRLHHVVVNGIFCKTIYLHWYVNINLQENVIQI